MKYVKLFEAWSQGEYTFKAISVFPEGGSNLYVGVFTEEYGNQIYRQLSKMEGVSLRMIDLPEGDDVVVSELGGEGLASGKSVDLGWDNLVYPGEDFPMDDAPDAIPFAVDRNLGAFVGIGGFGQTEVIEADKLLAKLSGAEELDGNQDPQDLSRYVGDTSDSKESVFIFAAEDSFYTVLADKRTCRELHELASPLVKYDDGLFKSLIFDEPGISFVGIDISADGSSSNGGFFVSGSTVKEIEGNPFMVYGPDGQYDMTKGADSIDLSLYPLKRDTANWIYQLGPHQQMTIQELIDAIQDNIDAFVENDL